MQNNPSTVDMLLASFLQKLTKGAGLEHERMKKRHVLEVPGRVVQLCRVHM